MRYLFFLSFIFTTLFITALLSDQQYMIIETLELNIDGDNPLDRWKEKSFAGHISYQIIQEDGNFVLHAFADSAASGLYKEIKYDVKKWPYLSWRWKVIKLPAKSDVHRRELDDYGARVYVIFPRFLKWKTKTINYIWAINLPAGKAKPNS